LVLIALVWGCAKDSFSGPRTRLGPEGLFTLEVPQSWDVAYSNGIEGGIFGEFTNRNNEVIISFGDEGDLYFSYSLDRFRQMIDTIRVVFAEDLVIDGNEATIAKVYGDGGPFLQMMIQGPDSTQTQFFSAARPADEAQIREIYRSHRYE